MTIYGDVMTHTFNQVMATQIDKKLAEQEAETQQHAQAQAQAAQEEAYRQTFADILNFP